MPSIVCLFWLWVHICLLLLSLFFGFLWLLRMWDPNPLTKDWTCAPCSGSMELKPLDHWGVPHLCFFFPFMFQMWWVCFILLWCKTKDSTTIQRPIYYKVMKKWCGTCGTWWTAGGSGHLLCNMRLYRHWGTHWKQHWGTELKYGTNVTTSRHAFKHLP